MLAGKNLNVGPMKGWRQESGSECDTDDRGEGAMQLTGMLQGSRLLRHVEFPTAEVLGPEATEDQIQGLIDRCGSVFIKPIFRGGVGKKGKSGLLGRAKDLKSALAEKERLYFAEHRHGNAYAKAQGVTFEGAVPAEHEVYFAIGDSTVYRAPTMTLTHMGGVDIEELDRRHVAEVPFEALTGLKAFVVANALSDIGAPKELVSPLVQHLPKLWELVHHYGMTVLELNPIRMMPAKGGRLVPVACDFKCGFDRDDPRWQRLGLPDHLFAADTSPFEQEINQLRTYQGQSDVFVINPAGTVLAPTFGGGANSLVTEVLGDDAIISSDFGGNPPYEKMRDVARICFKHWLKQSNVLFVIGGKSNNTDIFETLRAIADALREHFSQHGPTPLFVVIGRGGPNLVRGFGAFADTLDALGLPHRMFGFDSAISEVVNYAQKVDRWMKAGGRGEIARTLGLPATA
jgi:succinyl-CoA synthetase beta subunit